MSLARKLLFLLLAILTLSAEGLAASMTANEAVQEATDVLLKKLAEVKGVYATDPEKFYGEVNQALSPYIDFERFARGVMAKYYRTATEQQRGQFEEMFKHDLIQTYSKALAEFDNETIVVLPESGTASRSADEMPVKMEVHGKDGTIYPVQYSMVLTDGKWKLRNVIVNGLNIGLIFRKKFSDSMQQNGRDIDKVIATWDSSISEGS